MTKTRYAIKVKGYRERTIEFKDIQDLRGWLSRNAEYIEELGKWLTSFYNDEIEIIEQEEKKMTTADWNAGTAFLEKGNMGDCAEYENRAVVIGDMAGGRFELYDGSEFSGVTDEVWRAMEFLKSGRIFVRH